MLGRLRRRYPLRTLIAACLLGVCGASVLLLGGGLLYAVHDYLWRDMERHLRLTAIGGVNRTWPAPLAATRATSDSPGREPVHAPLAVPPGWRMSAEALTRSIGSPVVEAAVLDDRGNLLSSHGGPAGLRVPDAGVVARIQERFERDAARGEADSGISWRVEGPWQGLVLPLAENGHFAGVLQVAEDRGASDVQLRTFTGSMAAGTFAVLLLGLGVSLALARAVAEPLQELADATRKIAVGRWDTRVALGEGRNEVYRVASDFDAMVDQLQQAFEAQAQLIADASHELRTPLTVIGGMAEALALGLEDGNPEKRRRALEGILRESGRLTRLIEDLLMLARADHPDRQTGPVRLRALAEEVAEHASTLPGEHPVQVEIEGDPWVEGDAWQLERALRNLVENAAKYSPREAPIVIRCRALGKEADVSVVDRGVGIEAEHLSKVFDRFYRIDTSRSRKTGGHGLGLSIVRTVVERHGGVVAIESTPGQGTTIRFRLPLLPTRHGTG